jgi:hypothetical protein
VSKPLTVATDNSPNRRCGARSSPHLVSAVSLHMTTQEAPLANIRSARLPLSSRSGRT